MFVGRAKNCSNNIEKDRPQRLDVLICRAGQILRGRMFSAKAASPRESSEEGNCGGRVVNQ